MSETCEQGDLVDGEGAEVECDHTEWENQGSGLHAKLETRSECTKRTNRIHALYWKYIVILHGMDNTVLSRYNALPVSLTKCVAAHFPTSLKSNTNFAQL